MNLLVTGGSGFIGKNICEHFEGKYNTIAPKHRELDLLDENMVRAFFIEHQIDVVIHSAAKPGHRNAKDPTRLFYSNTRMYYNLAREAENYGKMLVIGSGAIYDTRRNISKAKEDSYKTHLPFDEHGFCKWICARDIEKMSNIVELRLFGVFGKYEDYSIRCISNAICKAIFNMPITIKQNRRFSYLFIDDLMPILDYFINNDVKRKAYNICPDKDIELKSLAEKVRTISEKQLPILVEEPGLGLDYSGDNSRLRKELSNINFEFTPINLAIQRLYKWYEENQANIDIELLLFDK